MMAVRNEGPGLGPVLEAVAEQDYPAIDQTVVAVGPSSDHTQEIVDSAARRFHGIFPVTNAGGFVSTGLNKALRMISASYVVRIDGHCLVPRDYVSRLVRTIEATGADCVGPRLDTVGHTPKQRGIAAAMSSPFGVGGAKFRTSAKSGYVDTVPFGLYRRAVFDRIGPFREELVRNQDDEFNGRLRRSGGSIYMDADVVVRYLPRNSFGGLWRQYFQYGYWRTIGARFLGSPFRPRQLAPGLLVLVLTIGGTGVIAGHPLLLLVTALAYGCVLALCAIHVARRAKSLRTAVISAAAAATMHLAYGSGSWWSLLTVHHLESPGGVRIGRRVPASD